MADALPGFRRAIIRSPLGPLGLDAEDGVLVSIDFLESAVPLVAPRDELLREAAAQLARYFEDFRQPFTLPLRAGGTDYCRRIWAALRSIPPGRTETYGSLAASAGGSARSIGLACRSNPLPIVIPCHRVVGATGLGGFGGSRHGPALALKRWLLRHEGHLVD
jgi:methylated-DNA-[protein]-cysteine S-methyltransferase